MDLPNPFDMPDAYFAMDRNFRVLEMSHSAAHRFFRRPRMVTSVGERLRWPSGGDFQQKCEQALAQQKPAHFDVAWDEQRWVRVHVWPSRKALFVCLSDVPSRVRKAARG